MAGPAARWAPPRPAAAGSGWRGADWGPAAGQRGAAPAYDRSGAASWAPC
eukprot:gene5992-3403_t